ncbi:hypothetical protein D3C76_763140 [compost metagenome]
MTFVADPCAGSQDKKISRRNSAEAAFCFLCQGIGINPCDLCFAPEGIELIQQGLTILLQVGSVEAQVEIVESDHVHLNRLRGRRFMPIEMTFVGAVLTPSRPLCLNFHPCHPTCTVLDVVVHVFHRGAGCVRGVKLVCGAYPQIIAMHWPPAKPLSGPPRRLLGVDPRDCHRWLR